MTRTRRVAGPIADRARDDRAALDGAADRLRLHGRGNGEHEAGEDRLHALTLYRVGAPERGCLPCRDDAPRRRSSRRSLAAVALGFTVRSSLGSAGPAPAAADPRVATEPIRSRRRRSPAEERPARRRGSSASSGATRARSAVPTPAGSCAASGFPSEGERLLHVGPRAEAARRTAPGGAGAPTGSCGRRSGCCGSSPPRIRGRPRVGVGDLSRPHGGDFGRRFGPLGHASHQNGLDVDVYYPRLDRLERAPRSPAPGRPRAGAGPRGPLRRRGRVRVFVGPNVGLTGPPRSSCARPARQPPARPARAGSG